MRADRQVEDVRLALAGALHDGGVDGLLRDKTRPSRIPPLGAKVAERVVAADARPIRRARPRTGPPPDGQGSGISVSSVQRIWRTHGLQPHRMRQFKLSNDPQFAAKLRDIVGLYVDPPAHAVVLSIDEKSQIQALDRTQPGLPHEEGPLRHHDPRLQAAWHHHAVCRPQRAGRQGHRPLHAAAPASGVHPLPQRHRGRRCRPASSIHAIVDNYATHKHPKVRAWLARHPRWTFHFTPNFRSWLNAVEGFFAKLTKRRLKRGVFRSIVDLQAAINRFLAETNEDTKPFVWTKTPTKSSPPSNEGTKC